ncbi:C-Maf-inducing protein [Eumeta japonica]|uniref:C-Maf-inducing protein n=1 Tax=Eumeta variegata TaxID=151549 RepID=A0A4C1WEM7_EUMVA|nr:C-Maf-inducing protein [Eumeta japonica]
MQTLISYKYTYNYYGCRSTKIRFRSNGQTDKSPLRSADFIVTRHELPDLTSEDTAARPRVSRTGAGLFLDGFEADAFMARSCLLLLSHTNFNYAHPCGLLERPLYYSSMQEVFRMARWDPARKYCLRVVMPQGSLLLQANDVYTRDQWYHSITWRRNMVKYRKSITKKIKKDEVLRELKNMVDFAMTTPLQDEEVTQVPMELLTNLLAEVARVRYKKGNACDAIRIRQFNDIDLNLRHFLSKDEDSPDWDEWAEGATSTAAPLLAERCAGGPLCALLARLCRRARTAPPPALAPPVRRVLTRNVDFARAPHARQLVRDYISALSSHASGPGLVRRFVEVTHGAGAACPHPRAAPNLVAVALAALDDHYGGDGPSPTTLAPAPPPPHRCSDDEEQVLCFADILVYMCEWEDWLYVVAGVLQPVPVRAAALRCPRVAVRLQRVLAAMARDPRCAVHVCLAPARAARTRPPSWLRTAAPANPLLALPHKELCKLWGDMINILLKCCFKRKSFLQEMSRHLPDFLHVALTEHPAAIEALCLMLEWDVANGEQTQLEIIAALQGTELGQEHYRELCAREQNLKKLQAEGGPRRLALPVRATDADVAALLEAGALGNLEYLSLAFTSVTSACAHYLIKLPSLRYLNLWATQFGDSGLQLIAEHLPRLQVLNLCETPVSDKGIEALSALSNLRRLNLNSTKLSAEAFADLKQRLPQLQEYDVRYTEAW